MQVHNIALTKSKKVIYFVYMLERALRGIINAKYRIKAETRRQQVLFQQEQAAQDARLLAAGERDAARRARSKEATSATWGRLNPITIFSRTQPKPA